MATDAALEMRPMNQTFADEVEFGSRYTPRNEPIRTDNGNILLYA